MKELSTFVGGELVAGKKLKSITGWLDGGNGTDEYGFKALAGSDRNGNRSFSYMEGIAGTWWTICRNYGLKTGFLKSLS